MRPFRPQIRAPKKPDNATEKPRKADGQRKRWQKSRKGRHGRRKALTGGLN